MLHAKVFSVIESKMSFIGVSKDVTTLMLNMLRAKDHIACKVHRTNT